MKLQTCFQDTEFILSTQRQTNQDIIGYISVTKQPHTADLTSPMQPMGVDDETHWYKSQVFWPKHVFHCSYVLGNEH